MFAKIALEVIGVVALVIGVGMLAGLVLSWTGLGILDVFKEVEIKPQLRLTLSKIIIIAVCCIGLGIKLCLLAFKL